MPVSGCLNYVVLDRQDGVQAPTKVDFAQCICQVDYFLDVSGEQAFRSRLFDWPVT